MIDQEVLTLANKVRTWAERRAKRAGGVWGTSMDLDCYCAIASARLSVVLEKAGIEHWLYISETDMGGHVYVVVGKTIVDVTATQFGMQDKVFVRPLRGAGKSHWYYKMTQRFTNARDLVLHQKISGWPDTQIIKASEMRPR